MVFFQNLPSSVVNDKKTVCKVPGFIESSGGMFRLDIRTCTAITKNAQNFLFYLLRY